MGQEPVVLFNKSSPSGLNFADVRLQSFELYSSTYIFYTFYYILLVYFYILLVCSTFNPSLSHFDCVCAFSSPFLPNYHQCLGCDKKAVRQATILSKAVNLKAPARSLPDVASPASAGTIMSAINLLGTKIDTQTVAFQQEMASLCEELHTTVATLQPASLQLVFASCEQLETNLKVLL